MEYHCHISSPQTTVPLELINPEDRAFVVTTGESTALLEQSILRIGLVNPPILFFLEANGYYQIVCGYRRIRALQALGRDETPALIIRSTTPEKETFMLSLFDNAAHRIFDAIEQAGIAARLLRYFAAETVIRDYLPLIGLPPTAKSLAAMRSLDALESETKAAVAQGTMSPGAAMKLAHCSAAERAGFLHLFSRAHFSASKQEEIISHCMDIALKNDSSCTDILHDAALEAILTQDKLSLSQKGDRIRSVLKKKRYPALSRCEARFVQKRTKLHLPAGVELLPPPFFEGGTYRLQVDFTSTAELQQKITQAAECAGSTIMHELLEDD